LARASRVIFTTHGVWAPKVGTDGTFIHWAEIHEVRVDGSFLVLRSGEATVRFNVDVFKDPYAVNRLIRERVPTPIAGHLEVEGEI
jgi:hypothetical protein